MTIDQAYKFIQFVYNKAQTGYIEPSQFNMLAPIMQMSLINDRLGNVKKYRSPNQSPPYGFNSSQKIREELKGIMVKPTTIAISSGKFNYPADYLYYDTISAGDKLVQEVTEDQIVELNNSLIRPPSATYPKCVLHQEGIFVYPTSITSIKLAYVRKPDDPTWGYTIVNDEPVYDAGSSTDFEVGETAQLEVCMMILSAVGVNLSMAEVVQYAEQQKAQGA